MARKLITNGNPPVVVYGEAIDKTIRKHYNLDTPEEVKTLAMLKSLNVVDLSDPRGTALIPEVHPQWATLYHENGTSERLMEQGTIMIDLAQNHTQVPVLFWFELSNELTVEVWVDDKPSIEVLPYVESLIPALHDPEISDQTKSKISACLDILLSNIRRRAIMKLLSLQFPTN